MEHRRRRSLTIALVVAPFLLAGCSGSAQPLPSSTTFALTTSSPSSSSAGPTSSVGPTSISDLPPSTGAETADTDSAVVATELTVSTIVTGLASPWGLAFLPDGRAVVTGRDDGSITLIDTSGGEPAMTSAGVIEGVDHGGEGGLLGVAVSPTFAQDDLLYVYFTGADGNQIDTVALRDGKLADQQQGFGGIPKGNIHNGGRLVFGPDGLLYVGTGETGERDDAQDLASLGGKILRLTPDLEPAPGNPFGTAVYSYGHRNVQGLAFDDDGRLWASEFGQNTWDELNLITAGDNYGWPLVEGPDESGGFVAPQRVWPTSEASPSGIAFWNGSIWMAGLRGERLWQIPITEAANVATGEPVAQLTEVAGRLRTAQVAPDGSLWVTTSNTDGRGDVRDGDDRILRLQVTG
ncbi:MAG: PQQ-dependent sugar dehydrogenase [Nakamurella sp.]